MEAAHYLRHQVVEHRPIRLLAPFVADTVAAAARMSELEPLSSTPAPTAS